MSADGIIEEIIREHPGITPGEISDMCDYAWGTISASLYRLYMDCIVFSKWDRGIRQYHYYHILPPRGGSS